MLPDFADISRRWITFGPRIEAGCVTLQAELALSGIDPVARQFLLSLAEAFPAARLDDLETLFFNFASRAPRLPDWYNETLDALNIEVRFEGDEPRIQPRQFNRTTRFCESWMDLCGWIDPDALITLQFALTMTRDMSSGDLENWGVYPRIHDPVVLGQPLWRRLRDIHTHLSGCEPAPLVWQELLSGQLSIDALPAYNPRNEDVFGDWETRFLEKKRIEAALAAWRRIYEATPIRSRHQNVAKQARELWRERAMLQHGWLTLLSDEPPDLDFMQRFDQYLSGKNSFVRRHIQSPSNNPGLENFRRHFDHLKLIRETRTPRVERILLARWRDFAFDSHALDHIEFRIAPMRDRASYSRFLASLYSVFHLAARQPPRPGIPGRSMPRFVVHFIRPWMKSKHGASWLNIDRLRKDLDRQFMALRHFLYDDGLTERRDRAQPETEGRGDVSRPSLQELRNLVSGIDVANVERDTPIELYAPYVIFLRGQNLDQQGRALLALETPYLNYTADYYRRGYQNANQGQMGLTVHAGEDYFHPLIGLREIWNAVNLCKMRPTDRIGHGLALGVDFSEHAHKSNGRYVAPVGRLLDAVVWADRRLGIVDGVDRRVFRMLEDVVSELSRAVYGRLVGSEVHYEVIRLRQFPVGMDRYDDPLFHELTGFHREARELKLAREDSFDKDLAKRRAKIIPVPEVLTQPIVTSAFNSLREQLVDEVCQRRIVIEMNPTSNRCVGDFDRMCEHPILRLKHRRPDLLVSISTDDPGNFGTRIENEYALVAQGLRELGQSESQVYESIAHMIVVSHDYAFGRAGYVNTQASWTSDVTDVHFSEIVRHDPRSGPD